MKLAEGTMMKRIVNRSGIVLWLAIAVVLWNGSTNCLADEKGTSDRESAQVREAKDIPTAPEPNEPGANAPKAAPAKEQPPKPEPPKPETEKPEKEKPETAKPETKMPKAPKPKEEMPSENGSPKSEKPEKEKAPEEPSEPKRPAPTKEQKKQKEESNQAPAPPKPKDPPPEIKTPVAPKLKTRDLTEFLITKVERSGRTAIHRDWVEEQVVRGTWKPPKAGESVKLPSGAKRSWQPITADEKQVVSIPTERKNSYYAATTVEMDEAAVWILEARGHSVVYVNGTPRVGDPFKTGWVRLPVWLNKGANHLLFHVGQSFSAKLVEPASPVMLNLGDTTLPDLLLEDAGPWQMSLAVINAQKEYSKNLVLIAKAEGYETSRTPLPPLMPLGISKVGFQLDGKPPVEGNRLTVSLRIVEVRTTDEEKPKGETKNKAEADKEKDAEEETNEESDSTDEAEMEKEKAMEEITLASGEVTLRIRSADQLHKRTFVSDVDGSVQYYMVRPATGEKSEQVASEEDDSKGVGEKDSDAKKAKSTKRTVRKSKKPGMIVTLHGAAVEASRHVRYMAAKPWAHVIAPTNRRPYGFDWEDWGRQDAMEVLQESLDKYPTDENRVYLSGHSMGGHGTWRLGALYPDQFAAIAPSAGWVSLWTYGGMKVADKKKPIELMFSRSSHGSDTLKLVRNYSPLGVYVQHGSKDKNVPVSEARTFRAALGMFHTDFAYREFKEKGHWWGAPTIDAEEVEQFFRDRTRTDRSDLNQIDFTTINPGVSSESGWVTVEAQQKQLEVSRVTIARDVKKRRFSGKTVNIARLMLDLSEFQPMKPFEVVLDGVRLRNIRLPKGKTKLWLARRGNLWVPSNQPNKSQKGPERYGMLKDAFRNRALLVYGTQGNSQENEWALAKARFDAETFWYRGNGSFEVMADEDFDSKREKDRNVILYGNADTNSAWGALLSTSPIQIRTNRVSMGTRPEMGDDLACLFVRPRPGSDRAVVAVIGGTGLPGMRLCDRVRYFTSGVAYPDLTLFSAASLHEGTDDVRAVGFFGLDWNVESGEFEWRDAAL